MNRIKHCIKLSALLLICCSLICCRKVITSTTAIYGIVIDMHTHEPVKGARIEVGYLEDYWNETVYYAINSHGRALSSSVSGSDGQFDISFGEVPENEGFYVKIICEGYADYYDLIGVSVGSNLRMDFIINPQ